MDEAEQARDAPEELCDVLGSREVVCRADRDQNSLPLNPVTML
jgi:hypothetical protein